MLGKNSQVKVKESLNNYNTPQVKRINMAETNNSTNEYIKTLREQAVRLDNDKYLLKLADAVEQNKGVLSATIEIAVASRIFLYSLLRDLNGNISPLTSLNSSRRLELLRGENSILKRLDKIKDTEFYSTNDDLDIKVPVT